jgi:hypothetical protein
LSWSCVYIYIYFKGRGSVLDRSVKRGWDGYWMDDGRSVYTAELVGAIDTFCQGLRSMASRNGERR